MIEVHIRRARGSRVLAIAMIAGLALAGCGDDDAPPVTDPDAGPPRDDGGPPRVDAGPGDAGPSPVDGGPGDAGPSDGGPPDAGPTDAGPPPVTFDETERAIIATLSPRPALPPDPTNAVADDPRAAALGQALFFDARYSGPLVIASDLGAAGETGRVSCASCHGSPVMSDDRSIPGTVSVGTNNHTRNAPAIVDSALYPWTNWGGRFSAQWELPPVVAENAAIMNSSRLRIAHHIFDHYREEYEAIFGAMEPAIGTDLVRFPLSGKPNAPGGAWESMTDADRAIINRIFVNFGKVIQAYMRLLVSGPSALDRFVAGDETALSQSAQRGLRLFIGDARCISCHSGPTLSDGAFHNLGVPQTGELVPPSDDGRFRDTPPLLMSPLNSAGAFSDDPVAGMARLAGLTNPPPESARGQFRTPTLRGLAYSAPYMHSGQLGTLEDVVAFYDRGGGTPVSGQRSALLFPLGLDEQERADLVELLMALSAEPIDAALRSPP